MSRSELNRCNLRTQAACLPVHSAYKIFIGQSVIYWVAWLLVGLSVLATCSPSETKGMYRYDAKLGLKPRFGPCTEQQIAEFEKQIGMTLPDDFRQFLLQWNGCTFQGIPAFPLREPEDPDDYGTIHGVFGLATEPSPDDLRYAGMGLDFDERVPEHILAIGDNGYHQFICVSLGGTDRGSVYLWRPGVPWEEDENVRTYEYMDLAAPTFREFYESLYVNPNPIYQ